MARKKGSSSTVMLSQEQLADICGEGSLVCVPRRWLKELGFDPDGDPYPEHDCQSRAIGVHLDGKEVYGYEDWRTINEKASDWLSVHPLAGLVPLANRIENGELDFDPEAEGLEYMDLVNFERRRKARLYDMGPELAAFLGDWNDQQIVKALKEVIQERVDPDAAIKTQYAPDSHTLSS